ncbi:MAG: hypothetical protein WD988_00940 [Candidatus Curtissbacteria bacterium]
MMTKNIVPILIIFISSLILSIPLFKPGFYTVHDDQQFARLYEFDKSVKSGQFPVRWVQDLGFGFGYPLFVFYPPFVYLLGEAFHLMGAGFVDSIKLVFYVSIFGSGVAMYILTKEFWGKIAALTSAIFYMIAPYRALDIYVRGALAESFSFVWLPLILWSYHKLQKTQKSVYIAICGILLALLMITHNLIFMPFMLILGLFIPFLLVTTTNPKRFILQAITSFILGISLSAFFWIPALYEKQFTIVDQLLLVNLADFRIHFVYPQQLWNWPWGFGGSTAGLADGMSFKIGKLHIIVALGAVGLAMLHQMAIKTKSKKDFHLTYLFFGLFAFSAFMTTSYSFIIWDLVPPLGYLQFPWRFLTFATLASAVLAGVFIYFLRLQILRIVFLILFIILLFLPNLKLFKPQAYRHNLSDGAVTAKENINWDVSRSSFEYVPKGVELYRNNLGGNTIKIDKTQIPQERIVIQSGIAKVDILRENPSHIVLRVDAEQESQLKANIFNFPGWQLKIDGAVQEIDDDNNLKLITFNVPKGSHDAELVFKNTLDRSIANAITAAAIIAFAMIIALGDNRLIKNITNGRPKF